MPKRKSPKPRFYDWGRTFTHQTGSDGQICVVVGGKGIGKTFGLRKALIKKHLKTGACFAEIFRSKSEKDEACKGYFDKLQHEGFFKNYVFKTDKDGGFIAPYVDDLSDAEWQRICYFVALTNFQAEKKRTYAAVESVIYDEFIIDSRDRYHRYLPNEYALLANLLDTIFREQPNDGIQRRLYLLGNSCGLVNPYFEAFGIDRIPDYGYSWHMGKTVLLHRVPPIDADARRESTFVGKMLAGTAESDMIFDNRFDMGYMGDVEPKTHEAKYMYSIVYGDRCFALWIDRKQGHLYVCKKEPKGKNAKRYKLSKSDGGINRAAVRMADDVIKFVIECYYANLIRYETVQLRALFFGVLDILGIK